MKPRATSPTCPNGHPRDLWNTVVYKGWWKEGSYRIRCRTCDLERGRRKPKWGTPEQRREHNKRSSLKRAWSRPMRLCRRCGLVLLPGPRPLYRGHSCMPLEQNWGGVLCPQCGTFKGERNRRDARCEHHLTTSGRRYRDDAEHRQRLRDKARYEASLRRARVRTGDFITIAALIERDGDRCYMCGEQVSDQWHIGHPRKANIEHVVPLSRGGAHSWDNVRVACRLCNYRKWNRVAA